MITRYLLIVVVFAVGTYRATQGAWLAAAGLFAMGLGLVVLKVAETKPAVRPIAYVCFLATAATIAAMLIQGRQ